MDDLVRRLRERDIAAWSDAYSCRARGVEAADAIEALTARAEAAEARVAELEVRLEIDHYFTSDEDGNFTRHEATPEERRVLPDKIDCLEASLELANERVDRARNKALEDAAKICDAEADRCDDAAKFAASGAYKKRCEAAAYAMRDRAAAIRALKSDPERG